MFKRETATLSIVNHKFHWRARNLHDGLLKNLIAAQ